MKISQELYEALRLSKRNHYEIAQEVGVHPSVLSKILNGAEPLRPNDPRVVRVGRVLGISRKSLFSQD